MERDGCSIGDQFIHDSKEYTIAAVGQLFVLELLDDGFDKKWWRHVSLSQLYRTFYVDKPHRRIRWSFFMFMERDFSLERHEVSLKQGQEIVKRSVSDWTEITKFENIEHLGPNGHQLLPIVPPDVWEEHLKKSAPPKMSKEDRVEQKTFTEADEKKTNQSPIVPCDDDVVYV